MVQVIPVPPIPPTPAPDAVFVSNGPPAVVVAVTAIIGMIVLGIIIYPLIRALARRLEGKAVGGVETRELEARVAEVEHRLAEAEERLDFNERMLAQREPQLLPRDKAD